MKNLFKIASLSALCFLFASCEEERYGNEIQSVEKIAIDSIKIVNDTMDVFSVQSIQTFSNYASGCQGFYDYDYVRDGFTRTVTAYQYNVDGPCTMATHTEKSQFNFQPQQIGTYTFRFWKGGTDYITQTIVVK